MKRSFSRGKYFRFARWVRTKTLKHPLTGHREIGERTSHGVFASQERER